MKNFILAFFCLFVLQFSVGQNTILWKVVDTVHHKTSTLVGTFHQFGNSFVDSIPQIKNSLLNADIAIFESIDKIENTRSLINSRNTSDSIEKWLRKKDLNKLKELSEDWGVDLLKLKPIEITWKLQQEFQKTKCKTVKPTDTWDHFDNYLQHIAKEQNIDLIGLETDSLQLKLIERKFKSPSWKKERKNISTWLKYLTTNKYDRNQCNFATAYRKLDLDYNLETPCNDNILLKERNDKWMKALPDLLQTKNCFIAVGYFHLCYQCGLINQLKNKGFVIEPIPMNKS